MTWLFFGMFFAYVILGLNIRALSKGKLAITGVTEFTYALVNFAMIQQVAEAHNWYEAFGYAAGATLGCLTSIWITRRWD